MAKSDIIKIPFPKKIEVQLHPICQIDELPDGTEVSGINIYIDCHKLENLAGTKVAKEQGLLVRDRLVQKIRKQKFEVINVGDIFRDDDKLYYHFQVPEPENARLRSNYRRTIEGAAFTVQSELDIDQADERVVKRSRTEALIAEALKPFKGQTISDESILNIAAAIEKSLAELRKKSK